MTLITRDDDKPNARTVLVMQRVESEDLAGYFLEQGGYELLNLPAIATDDASFGLGYGFKHHRKEGDVPGAARVVRSGRLGGLQDVCAELIS